MDNQCASEWKFYAPKELVKGLCGGSVDEKPIKEAPTQLRGLLRKRQETSAFWHAFALPEVVQPTNSSVSPKRFQQIERAPPFNLEFVAVTPLRSIPPAALLLANAPDFHIRFPVDEASAHNTDHEKASSLDFFASVLLNSPDTVISSRGPSTPIILAKKAPSLYNPCTSLNRATSKQSSQLYALSVYRIDGELLLLGFPLVDLGNVSDKLSQQLLQSDLENWNDEFENDKNTADQINDCINKLECL